MRAGYRERSTPDKKVFLEVLDAFCVGKGVNLNGLLWQVTLAEGYQRAPGGGPLACEFAGGEGHQLEAEGDVHSPVFSRS